MIIASFILSAILFLFPGSVVAGGFLWWRSILCKDRHQHVFPRFIRIILCGYDPTDDPPVESSEPTVVASPSPTVTASLSPTETPSTSPTDTPSLTPTEIPSSAPMGGGASAPPEMLPADADINGSCGFVCVREDLQDTLCQGGRRTPCTLAASSQWFGTAYTCCAT